MEGRGVRGGVLLSAARVGRHSTAHLTSWVQKEKCGVGRTLHKGSFLV